jgi:hypothetical protein
MVAASLPYFVNGPPALSFKLTDCNDIVIYFTLYFFHFFPLFRYSHIFPSFISRAR